MNTLPCHRRRFAHAVAAAPVVAALPAVRVFCPVRGVINGCCQNLQGCFCSCMQAQSMFEVADTGAVCFVH